jgi:hypothetical protein
MKQCVRKILVTLLSGMLVVSFTPVFAADDDAAETATGGSAEDGNQVTQAELAKMLVNIMGLAPFVSLPATSFELFQILVSNGVVPESGWNAETIVTKADLARVLVQAMGAADEIENPDDPNSWIEYLQEMGVQMDTVGEAIAAVAPNTMSDPIINYALNEATTTDPLKKRGILGEPDEPQFGTDTTLTPLPLTEEQVAATGFPTREQIEDIIAMIPVQRPPTSRPTPDGGEA